MLLEKWYADSIGTNQTTPTIRYLAHLHCLGLKFSYAAQLGTEPFSRFRFGLNSIALPKVTQQTLNWASDTSDQTLSWHNSESRPVVLWKQADQYVIWNPRVLNSSSACSSSYVEQLILNVAPWKLGIRLLKWGRFCGPTRSLVWIEWEGKYPLKKVFLDGVQEELLKVEHDRVIANSVTLLITQCQPLVQETLESGALKKLGFLKALIPQNFQLGQENKWYGCGSLQLTSGEVEQGNVIYEEVTWGA